MAGDQKSIFKLIGAGVLILSLFITVCPKYNNNWSFIWVFIIVGVIFFFSDRIEEIKIFSIFSAKLKDKINQADKLTRSLYSLEKISTQLAIDNIIKDMTTEVLELSGGGNSRYVKSNEITLLEIIKSTSLSLKDKVEIIVDPIMNTLIFNQLKILRGRLNNQTDKVNANNIIYDNFGESSIKKYTPNDIDHFIEIFGGGDITIETLKKILLENNNEDKIAKFSQYLRDFK